MTVLPTGSRFQALFLACLTGLASCAPERESLRPFDPDNVILSEGAAELTATRKADAALAGTEAAGTSELICERRKQPGTHLTATYCYTREEWMRARGAAD